MRHYGLVCPAMTGHMHTMFAMGRELVRRGDRATVFAHPEARAKAERAELEFVPIGASDFPPDEFRDVMARLSMLVGRAAMSTMIEMGTRLTPGYVRDLPSLIRNHHVEALLVDEVSFLACIAARGVPIPYVGICSAIPAEFDWRVPPCGMNLGYRGGISGRARSLWGYLSLSWAMRQPSREFLRQVRRHKAWSWVRLLDWYRRLATIVQMPAEFEFPISRSETFHYVGPFIDPALRTPVDFPYERLDGRPLIYASLGTILHGNCEIFRHIAAACDGLDAQLVISLGGGDPTTLERLPGNPLVVGYAPQLDLLRRATMTISHAGLNTVMESLACGVPAVVIPLSFDQPGVAARLEWSGAGLRILPEQLTTEQLRLAITRVLTTPSYREQAGRMRRAIESTGGPRQAADVIEATLLSQQSP